MKSAKNMKVEKIAKHLSIYLSIFSYFLHAALSSCCKFFRQALFSCRTFFMLQFSCAALFSCCSFSVLHCFLDAFLCSSFFMLQFLRVPLFSCCTAMLEIFQNIFSGETFEAITFFSCAM